MSLDRVLEVLRARRNGSGWVALCPAHVDKNPSLGISEGDDGRVLLRCFAGCDFDAVRDAAGLEPSDLAPARAANNGSSIVATYDYTDEHGTVLFQVCRSLPKSFRQRRPDAHGGWSWKLGDVRRVPYRLPELLEGVASGRWVIVCEGEKDAATLVTAGFVATCNAGGAGKWRDEWAPMFAGARVAIVPDNDEPGRKHADEVAASLGVGAEVVKVIALGGLAEHGDVTDWFTAGGSAAALKEEITRAPAWVPPKVRGPVRALSWAEVYGEDGAHREPDAVDGAGAELLDEVAAFIARYVACSTAAIHAGALWTVHTHAFAAAEASPRFAVLSAEPGSGKTRFLEVFRLLVRDPLFAVNVSDAALFRIVEARTPTVLHDEVDAVFGPKARDREDLRGMLNAGYERGATVARVVGEGKNMTVKEFKVYAPVALAGIGRLPETVETRSIVVHMKRRAPDEAVARLRRRKVEPEAERLRGRLETWAAEHVKELARAEPDLPEELDDRAQDIWEPLVAIADHAGGDWPDRARGAARALFGARRTDEATIGIRLLTDIATVFERDTVLGSGMLAERLTNVEGAPWADWSGKGFTAHALAKLLKRYDIRPAQHWTDAGNVRGYRLVDFTDAFVRYLSPEVLGAGELLGRSPSAGAGSNSCNTPNTFFKPDPENARDVDLLARELGARVAEEREL